MSLAPKENSNVSGTEFGWFWIKDGSEEGIEGRKSWRTHQAGVCPIEKAFAKSQTRSVDGSHAVDVASASHSGLKPRCICAIARKEPRKPSKDGELAEKERGQLCRRREHQENDGRSPSAEGARAITFDPNITFGPKTV
ncbi:hypothetical protein B0H10DRAFT_1969106 [Mycena sp. CBHHK59/15]|nr:hypothetical protein B0H10DRAFT_1969106 [Mycena sp. CBHHK59/15]